jgi:crotonobetainyl-CoA:carnitine CoA-transferase CaiB-like acyl-CoA transferase
VRPAAERLDDMLENVRIGDLTTDIAGPSGTKVLADAGAHVVMVEPAGGEALVAEGNP